MPVDIQLPCDAEAHSKARTISRAFCADTPKVLSNRTAAAVIHHEETLSPAYQPRSPAARELLSPIEGRPGWPLFFRRRK